MVVVMRRTWPEIQTRKRFGQASGERRLARPRGAHRAGTAVQKRPVDLAAQPHQRMPRIDDRLQRRPKQVVLAVVARLARRPSPKSETGIPNRKKTARRTPHSCKIDDCLSADHTLWSSPGFVDTIRL